MDDQALSVSIIMPVFNGEKFLAEAVASVAAQSPPVLEIIIVDDGSTDKTADLAREMDAPVRYVRQDNRGPAAARNVGIKMARGEVIGFLDADDLWCEGLVSRQLEILFADPSLDIVKGMTLFTRATQSPDGGTTYKPYGEPVLFPNLCGTLYRRELFDTVGPLNEELRFAEDVDWMVRAKEKGTKIRVIDEVTQYHRRHEGNMTRGRNFKELNGFEVIKLALARRQKKGGARRGDFDGE